MARNFISAVGVLMSMQRWNFLPRIETWTEAENAAYVAHLGYAVAREMGEDDDFILHLILRTLLQSFAKYEISDIPRHIAETLRSIPVEGSGGNKNYFSILRDTAAKKTSEDLFPRIISNDIKPYMESKATFNNTNDETAKRIENLFNYCKRKAALEECVTNKKIYEKAYEEREKEIRESVAEIPCFKEYEEILSSYEEYFLTVRNLKYLIRWNRIKRNLESSVLAHTYVTTLLAIIHSLCEEKIFARVYIPETIGEIKNLKFNAVLLSLFHDILESLTGDVITPVKHRINELAALSEQQSPWEQVENKHRAVIEKMMPPKVREDVKTRNLLNELNMNELFSVSSFTKQCDMLALIIECILELQNKPAIPEMRTAANEYLECFRNAEWLSLYQLAREIRMEYSDVLKEKNK